MIEFLSYGKQQGWDRLKNAIEQALQLDCMDAAAVRHLLSFGELVRAPRQDCESPSQTGALRATPAADE